MHTLTEPHNSTVAAGSTPAPTLLLFDLSIRGHHPSYLRHLIQYWCDQGLQGRLGIVVSPAFLAEHAEVVALAERYPDAGVEFVAITPQEAAALQSRKSRLQRVLLAFQEWQLLARYAARLQASHCLVMYFDTYQLPLALGSSVPCPVSSIYFRPTFHYPTFTHYGAGEKERLQHWREKILLHRVLRHRQLHTLFCLDPFVVPYLQRWGSRAVALPDPVEVSQSVSPDQVEALRQQLGVEPGRRVLLLFGALTERKGIFPLLEAIAQLSAEHCQQLCLLLVGESKIASQIDPRVATLCQTQPLQILRHYQFVAEETVQTYFHLADLVLAPYQQHVGMSGILLQAAAAQKPVLSSDYGLMGEMVERHGLGLAVDSTEPAAIAEGIRQFLIAAPGSIGDRAQMQTFAEQNAAPRFAQIIFDHISG